MFHFASRPFQRFFFIALYTCEVGVSRQDGRLLDCLSHQSRWLNSRGRSNRGNIANRGSIVLAHLLQRFHCFGTPSAEIPLFWHTIYVGSVVLAHFLRRLHCFGAYSVEVSIFSIHPLRRFQYLGTLFAEVPLFRHTICRDSMVWLLTICGLWQRQLAFFRNWYACCTDKCKCNRECEPPLRDVMSLLCNRRECNQLT